MSIMSAPHHLHMKSNDQLLNSSKGSVLKKVYFNFLQGEQLSVFSVNMHCYHCYIILCSHTLYPITFMHVTNAHNPTTTLCTRTLKSRCSGLQDIRRIVSGGEPSALLQSEVLSLSNEERKSLLNEAGISDEIKIGPAEVLAINVGLAIPWNKIRLLRRYVEVIYSHASHDIDVISGG